MNVWPHVPLAELVHADRGISYGVVQPGLPVEDGIPIVRVTDVRNGLIATTSPMRIASGIEARHVRTRLRGGELLLTLVGTVGETAVVPASLAGWNTARAVAVIPVLDDIGAKWVQLALATPSVRESMFTRLNTTVQATLNLRDVLSLSIPLPPLEPRRAITHILETLDDKIELNRRTNETLEGMARALFKSWFVDFDPVHAKKEGRKPHGMDAATAAVLPAAFEHSAIGPIPQGWACEPVGALVAALSGGTPSKNDPSLWNGPIPWISPKIMRSIHVYESEARVSIDAVGNGTRLAPAGSTLVMVRGMGLHEEVRVSQALRDVAFNQDVKALVPARIHSALLLFALLDGQADLLTRVESSGHGTGRLPSDILLAHPITLPGGAVQATLARPFECMNEKIGALRHQSECLIALRDALLPKLLSGEIRVPEAERIVGKAV